ncbi:hypothetical protein AB0D14_20850 [Streptomyces sp. NPDC048484]
MDTSITRTTFGDGSDFDHFEFGLQRILDGLDVFVGRRRESSRDDR